MGDADFQIRKGFGQTVNVARVIIFYRIDSAAVLQDEWDMMLFTFFINGEKPFIIGMHKIFFKPEAGLHINAGAWPVKDIFFNAFQRLLFCAIL